MTFLFLEKRRGWLTKLRVHNVLYMYVHEFIYMYCVAPFLGSPLVHNYYMTSELALARKTGGARVSSKVMQSCEHIYIIYNTQERTKHWLQLTPG